MQNLVIYQLHINENWHYYQWQPYSFWDILVFSGLSGKFDWWLPQLQLAAAVVVTKELATDTSLLNHHYYHESLGAGQRFETLTDKILHS
ncbi:hypothetical protein BDR04DRAFT_733116 [Suillus decipiens]|nr:hypothetical protein BDR04DRAFT_733116 [Suillus decipiens]